MTRSQRKKIQKGQQTLLSVIQFLLVLSHHSSLHFGRRRFFGDPFLCVFPQRRLVNVANFRRGDERGSILFFLFSASTLLSRTFEEDHPKGGGALARTRFECQIFWKRCKQVESPSVSVSERDSVIFSPFFRESKVSVVLIANRLSSVKEMKFKLTLGNE